MRIPSAATDTGDLSPEDKAIHERIKARRGPRGLIPLDHALLHNPEIADGFNSFMGAIRSKSSISRALQEVAICYVAVLNQAHFEWAAHAPMALKAGVTRKALEAMLNRDIRNSSALTEDEINVLAFTEQSTKNIRVDDDLFGKIKSRFTDQEVLELTITVASYNMVSRFLVALDVAEANEKNLELPPPSERETNL